MTIARSRILAIDDSPESIENLESAIASILPDAEFFSAPNALKGLELALARDPDIILLDVVMPELDGIEACRRIRDDARLRNIPVVLITALEPDKALCEKAFNAGAEAFITKPVRLWELAVLIRAMGKLKTAAVSQQQEQARLQEIVSRRTKELAQELVSREKALEKLAESELLFKTVFECAPMGLCLVDSRTGRYLRVNPTLVKITGRSADELAALSWSRITPTEEIKPIQDGLRALDRGNSEIFRTEKRYLRPDGSTVPVKLTITSLPAYDNSSARYLAMVEDISAAKEAGQEKLLLEEQLRQSQKMETAGRLAGGIAHDFNNILSAMLAYSDFLLKGFVEGCPRREDAEEIKKAGLRAAALTRQLLAFSRKQVLNPEVLDVNQVFHGMKAMLNRLLGEDIKLSIAASKAPVFIKADQGYLEQVLLNLCVNARDAMPKGGKLVLEVSRVRMDDNYVQRHGTITPGDYVLLQVSDTGSGMSAEVQSHIFEPFFTTKPKDKGTGLGLSTVHGIVRQSGGHIAVYSEPGHGTVFKLFFPEVGPEAPQAGETPRHALARAEGGTVLLVDDDAQMRTVARRILAADGFEVLEAGSAEEALAVCRRRGKPVSLLLTDMVLPRLNGFELARKLRALHPDLLVLFMSGYTEHASLEDDLLDPERNFIQKPFTLDALTQKVRETISSRAPAPKRE